MKRIAFIILTFVLAAPAGHPQMFQKTIDGRVLNADPAAQTISIISIHPVSGQEMLKEFRISDGAGFKNVKNLKQIKAGDLVSIDYIEEFGRFTAMYVLVVPTDKPPLSRGEVGGFLKDLATARIKHPASSGS